MGKGREEREKEKRKKENKAKRRERTCMEGEHKTKHKRSLGYHLE